ncbi:MAG: aspartate 1-decarboxylase [Dehalococcoidia bacterium]|nr:aspartate 1-decarboxylase [Dehalococcoidia bacterium]
MRIMLKGKIHRAHVTDADLNYEGSITLDPILMEAADLLPFERVHVLDITNGARLETYAIEGERGGGEVAINGAAAHLVHKGDLVIVLSYSSVSEEESQHWLPKLVYVDAENRIVRLGGAAVQPQEAVV